MIIAQISDTHIALDGDDAGQRIRNFEDTVADINSLDPAPDVIIHSGDIVHNGRQDEYARAAAILAKAGAPVFVMVGNKDNRDRLREAFPSIAHFTTGSDFIDYTIEGYPVRLIALDTLNTNSNRGDFCDQRVEQFITMIDADPSRPIAVFAHHPPFRVDVGPDPIHFESLEAMAKLRQSLQHSGRVMAVFSGHVHRPAEGMVEGIPAIVMPCIATPLRRGEYPAAMKTRPVYYIHRLDPAWGFSTEARIV